jgi:hypothetical protein
MRQRIGGLALSLVLAASSYGGPQDAGMPRTQTQGKITIRIHDYAQVKSSVLLKAERAAADILREAGVDSVWVECPPDQIELADAACTSPGSPLDLRLNLLPRSKARHLHYRDETLGVAAADETTGFGSFAYVFYDNVKDCAVEWRLNLAQLLGETVAHELGHLLLGTNSHSSHGLMGAFWSGKELLVAEQRGLSFSYSEKKRLQIALTDRTLAALSDAVSPDLLPIASTQTGSATGK